jgi:sugar phosphate isomerase/epimerase
MRFCGRTQPLRHYPIGECLGVIARLGFDGVELCLENDDLHVPLLTPEKVAAVAERIAALGLTPFSVSDHRDYVHDDAIFAELQQAIALAPAFGAEVFVFGGGPARGTWAEEWPNLVARTRVLVQVAEAHDVALANEFEPGFLLDSTAKLMQLFDAVPSAYFGANLDLGHAFLCDPDPLGAIRALGTKIYHCHIENMAAGVHSHLLPHEGDMDLGAYLATLAEVGFDGGLALDLYAHDYEAIAPSALAYMRGIMPRTSE